MQKNIIDNKLCVIFNDIPHHNYFYYNIFELFHVIFIIHNYHLFDDSFVASQKQFKNISIKSIMFKLNSDIIKINNDDPRNALLVMSNAKSICLECSTRKLLSGIVNNYWIYENNMFFVGCFNKENTSEEKITNITTNLKIKE